MLTVTVTRVASSLDPRTFKGSRMKITIVEMAPDSRAHRSNTPKNLQFLPTNQKIDRPMAATAEVRADQGAAVSPIPASNLKNTGTLKAQAPRTTTLRTTTTTRVMMTRMTTIILKITIMRETELVGQTAQTRTAVEITITATRAQMRKTIAAITKRARRTIHL